MADRRLPPHAPRINTDPSQCIAWSGCPAGTGLVCTAHTRGRTPPAHGAVLRPGGLDRLARQLDPEDLRQVIRAYQATCAAVIQHFAGHIAQYLGDGLLVYFGYPQAHEDDAPRAVHTGLRIVEAIGTLNTDLVRDHGVRLAVRVGIHTGLVVVGEMGSGDRPERLALGETPNLAARLQGWQPPTRWSSAPPRSSSCRGYSPVRRGRTPA